MFLLNSPWNISHFNTELESPGKVFLTDSSSFKGECEPETTGNQTISTSDSLSAMKHFK